MALFLWLITGCLLPRRVASSHGFSSTLPHHPRPLPSLPTPTSRPPLPTPQTSCTVPDAELDSWRRHLDICGSWHYRAPVLRDLGWKLLERRRPTHLLHVSRPSLKGRRSHLLIWAPKQAQQDCFSVGRCVQIDGLWSGVCQVLEP